VNFFFGIIPFHSDLTKSLHVDCSPQHPISLTHRTRLWNDLNGKKIKVLDDEENKMTYKNLRLSRLGTEKDVGDPWASLRKYLQKVLENFKSIESDLLLETMTVLRQLVLFGLVSKEDNKKFFRLLCVILAESTDDDRESMVLLSHPHL